MSRELWAVGFERLWPLAIGHWPRIRDEVSCCLGNEALGQLKTGYHEIGLGR